MFLDLVILSSDATGDVEDVDTVASGGNKDVAVFNGDPDNDNDAEGDGDDNDCESNDAVADIAMVVVAKMLPDSRLLSPDAIDDDESFDTVGDGGNGGVGIIKDDPDNDNDADKDDQEHDDDDWDTDADVGMVVIDEDGNGDDGNGVDCVSVPMSGLKYD